MIYLPIESVEQNTGQIEGLPSNPRQWTQTDIDRLAKSLEETPELFEARPLIVYPYKDKYVILGGNLRFSATKKLKMQEVPVHILDEDLSLEKLKEIVIKDNGSFGDWDMDMLANEWDDLPLKDWGVNIAWDNIYLEETDFSKEEYERRKKEFEERISAGEITEGDEEYQEFLDKFAIKKTTDDCYTPKLVYEAVEQYVTEKYGIPKEKFVRPFYPNGDYQKEKYPKGCVVVDNPPFSIMAEILKFYTARDIPFFLFAPHLTIFSSSSSSATAICAGVPVIYENGASVNTSFLTNMEGDVRFRSAPKLYEMVAQAVEETQRAKKKELPKYSYDRHVVTSTFLGQLSRLGINFSANKKESERIAQLDSQKASGKAIYGKGYLISEQKYQEREKAEQEKVERDKREKAEIWELSSREKEIIKKLSE